MIEIKTRKGLQDKNNFMNPCAPGIISSYIWLDVPFLLHTTTISCIELIIATENEFISHFSRESYNHMITLQIKDVHFNPKHFHNRFLWGEFFLGTKKKSEMKSRQHLLMTLLDGVWFLKSQLPWGGASLHLLPTFAMWEHTSPW